jgi:hypothetical protein
MANRDRQYKQFLAVSTTFLAVRRPFRGVTGLAARAAPRHYPWGLAPSGFDRFLLWGCGRPGLLLRFGPTSRAAA